MAMNYTQLIKCCSISNTFIFDFVPCLINYNKKRISTTLFSLLAPFFDEEWGKKRWKRRKISQLLMRLWVAKVATITCNKFNCQVSCY